MTAERAATYRRLMASGGRGALFDRHLFACTLAAALAQHEKPLEEYLGDYRFFLDLIMDQGKDGMEVIPGRSI